MTAHPAGCAGPGTGPRRAMLSLSPSLGQSGWTARQSSSRRSRNESATARWSGRLWSAPLVPAEPTSAWSSLRILTASLAWRSRARSAGRRLDRALALCYRRACKPTPDSAWPPKRERHLRIFVRQNGPVVPDLSSSFQATTLRILDRAKFAFTQLGYTALAYTVLSLWGDNWIRGRNLHGVSLYVPQRYGWTGREPESFPLPFSYLSMADSTANRIEYWAVSILALVSCPSISRASANSMSLPMVITGAAAFSLSRCDIPMVAA